MGTFRGTAGRLGWPASGIFAEAGYARLLREELVELRASSENFAEMKDAGELWRQGIFPMLLA